MNDLSVFEGQQRARNRREVQQDSKVGLKSNNIMWFNTIPMKKQPDDENQQEFLLNVSTEARWRADLEVPPSVLTWIEVFRKRHKANFPFAQDAAAPFLITFFDNWWYETAGPTSLETFSGRGCSSRSTGWARHRQAVSNLFETSG